MKVRHLTRPRLGAFVADQIAKEGAVFTNWYGQAS